MSIPIRDNRGGRWGWFNYEVLDVYAPKIGANGVALYMALVRFANNDTQTTYPSLAKLAACAGMSERSAQRTLPLLIEVGLVEAAPQYDGDGRQKSNLYTLLDPATVVDRGDNLAPTGVTTWHREGDNLAPKQDPVNKTQKEQESDTPAPDLRISDVSPQSTNGHISNGRLVGYDTNASQSKGARPVAAEEPPPVVVKVPPGTPVNRRPDAPAVRPVPKPAPSSTLLPKWEPPPDFAEWYAEACAARKRPPTSIDLIAELQKFRVHPSTRKLASGEWGAHWQLWILRAFDGMGQPRGAPPAPTVTGQHYRVVSTKGD